MLQNIELNNGTIVQGSLGIMALKNLRHKDKSLYNDANRIIVKGADSVEDVLTAAYAGYAAVCKDEIEYTYDEFVSLLSDSVTEVARIVSKMI